MLNGNTYFIVIVERLGCEWLMCMSLLVRDRLVKDDWFLYRSNFFHGTKHTIEMQQKRILISFSLELSDPGSSETECFDVLVPCEVVDDYFSSGMASHSFADFRLENNTHL